MSYTALKTLERTNEHGLSKREIERLVDDVDVYLAELPRNGAKRITVQVTVELKGEPDA